MWSCWRCRVSGKFHGYLPDSWGYKPGGPGTLWVRQVSLWDDYCRAVLTLEAAELPQCFVGVLCWDGKLLSVPLGFLLPCLTAFTSKIRTCGSSFDSESYWHHKGLIGTSPVLEMFKWSYLFIVIYFEDIVKKQLKLQAVNYISSKRRAVVFNCVVFWGVVVNWSICVLLVANITDSLIIIKTFLEISISYVLE